MEKMLKNDNKLLLIVEWILDFLKLLFKWRWSLIGNEKIDVVNCIVIKVNSWLISEYLLFDKCKYVIILILSFDCCLDIEMYDFFFEFMYF